MLTTKQPTLPLFHLFTFKIKSNTCRHTEKPLRALALAELTRERLSLDTPTPQYITCRHITLISDLMRINRKGFLRVPTYLLTLQPPNTTFFPLIGSLSSTILVSTLHHHLFIDPIAFIYSRHWQQRVFKSSIICLVSKYSYNPIKYQNEISLSQIIKREFGNKKVMELCAFSFRSSAAATAGWSISEVFP